MNTRIRYVNSSGDTNAFIESVQNFQSNDGFFYKVYISVMDMNFTIKYVSNGEVATTGTGSSLHSLKSKAKKSLESLGVVFSNEKRSKSESKVAA